MSAQGPQNNQNSFLSSIYSFFASAGGYVVTTTKQVANLPTDASKCVRSITSLCSNADQTILDARVKLAQAGILETNNSTEEDGSSRSGSIPMTVIKHMLDKLMQKFNIPIDNLLTNSSTIDIPPSQREEIVNAIRNIMRPDSDPEENTIELKKFLSEYHVSIFGQSISSILEVTPNKNLVDKVKSLSNTSVSKKEQLSNQSQSNYEHKPCTINIINTCSTATHLISKYKINATDQNNYLTSTTITENTTPEINTQTDNQAKNLVQNISIYMAMSAVDSILGHNMHSHSDYCLFIEKKDYENIKKAYLSDENTKHSRMASFLFDKIHSSIKSNIEFSINEVINDIRETFTSKASTEKFLKEKLDLLSDYCNSVKRQLHDYAGNNKTPHIGLFENFLKKQLSEHPFPDNEKMTDDSFIKIVNKTLVCKYLKRPDLSFSIFNKKITIFSFLESIIFWFKKKICLRFLNSSNITKNNLSPSSEKAILTLKCSLSNWLLSKIKELQQTVQESNSTTEQESSSLPLSLPLSQTISTLSSAILNFTEIEQCQGKLDQLEHLERKQTPDKTALENILNLIFKSSLNLSETEAELKEKIISNALSDLVSLFTNNFHENREQLTVCILDAVNEMYSQVSDNQSLTTNTQEENLHESIAQSQAILSRDIAPKIIETSVLDFLQSATEHRHNQIVDFVNTLKKQFQNLSESIYSTTNMFDLNTDKGITTPEANIANLEILEKKYKQLVVEIYKTSSFCLRSISDDERFKALYKDTSYDYENAITCQMNYLQELLKDIDSNLLNISLYKEKILQVNTVESYIERLDDYFNLLNENKLTTLPKITLNLKSVSENILDKSQQLFSSLTDSTDDFKRQHSIKVQVETLQNTTEKLKEINLHKSDIQNLITQAEKITLLTSKIPTKQTPIKSFFITKIFKYNTKQNIEKRDKALAVFKESLKAYLDHCKNFKIIENSEFTPKLEALTDIPNESLIEYLKKEKKTIFSSLIASEDSLPLLTCLSQENNSLKQIAIENIRSCKILEDSLFKSFGINSDKALDKNFLIEVNQSLSDIKLFLKTNTIELRKCFSDSLTNKIKESENILNTLEKSSDDFAFQSFNLSSVNNDLIVKGCISFGETLLSQIISNSLVTILLPGIQNRVGTLIEAFTLKDVHLTALLRRFLYSIFVQPK